ncbi:MAG: trigger factor [Coriobacteriales bacterium]
METKIERLEDNKVKFEITIDAAEVDAAIDEVYDEVNRSTRIPGFRKGRAPRKVLESNFGAEYFSAVATANLIEEHSPQVVDEADMVPLNDFDYDAEESAKPGEDYTYSFTFLVKPELTLTSADPVEVELDPLEATDEEIDERIDTLCNYYIDLQPVTDRPVQEEDIVIYSQTCQVDGKDIDEGTEKRRTYVVGGGSKSKEFDEQIIGMNAGEEKDFILQSSELGLDSFDDVVPVTARVTVHEITEKAVPELTDEWVKKTLDIDTVEALREQTREQLVNEKKGSYERNKSFACLEALTERLEGEVTPEVVAEAGTKALRNFYMSLQASGYTLDQYLMATGTDAQTFYNDMEEQGKELAKQNMALDALARALEIEVTEDDIMEAFSEAEDATPEELRAEWENEHRMATLREEILRDKAAKWLYENAKITVKGEEAAADEEPAETEAEEA